MLYSLNILCMQRTVCLLGGDAVEAKISDGQILLVEVKFTEEKYVYVLCTF